MPNAFVCSRLTAIDQPLSFEVANSDCWLYWVGDGLVKLRSLKRTRYSEPKTALFYDARDGRSYI